MRTRNPILSPISYCEPQWLAQQLRSDSRVTHFRIMPHEADTDSTKAHLHVTIWCDGIVDLASLEASLTQYVPGNKPLTTRLINPRDNKPCLCNSVDDNTLYDEHNSAYLEAKGLTRNICDIPRSSWITDDDSEFHELLFQSADDALASMCVGGCVKGQHIIQLIEQGVLASDIMKQGYNPSMVNAAFSALRQGGNLVRLQHANERLSLDLKESTVAYDKLSTAVKLAGYDIEIDDLGDYHLVALDNPFS